MIYDWIWKYQPKQMLLSDALAGITVAAIAIPQSMSYASIAGLPVQYGLYSDLQVAYPLFGSSHALVVGPVAIMSLMIHEALSDIPVVVPSNPDHVDSDAGKSWNQKDLVIEEASINWIAMCSLMCFLVALMQFLFSFLSVGSLINQHFPHHIIQSFTAAAALTIASTQISSMLGISPCRGSCGFFETISHSFFTFANPKTIINIEVLLISVVSIISLILIRRIPHPICSKCGPLFLMIIGILFVSIYPVEERERLKCVGHIPMGLPSPHWPLSVIEQLPKFKFPIRTWIGLLVSAVQIALVGFIEAITIAHINHPNSKQQQHQHGVSSKSSESDDDYDGERVSLIPSSPSYSSPIQPLPLPIDDNQELIALGACNVVTGIVGGYPVSGSFSRSAVNASSGALSPFSTATAAVSVVIALEYFTFELSKLPRSIVASIVVFSILQLVSIKQASETLRKRNQESVEYLLVFVISLFFNVELGLLLGIVVHFIWNVTKRQNYA